MTTHPIAPAAETRAEIHAQDALHFRGILVRMVDLGAALAETVVQQAQAAAATPLPAGGVAQDFTNAFAQVTRSVRRSILLAQKLLEPAKPVTTAEDAEARRVAARKRIIRAVEDCIHREAPRAEEESLRGELMERIEGPEFDDDLDQRPIGDIITDIRADLGLAKVDGHSLHMRRTPEDIAILCERAAAPCRERVGPYNLPMPPRGWVDTGPPFAATMGPDDSPPIRGP